MNPISLSGNQTVLEAMERESRIVKEKVEREGQRTGDQDPSLSSHSQKDKYEVAEVSSGTEEKICCFPLFLPSRPSVGNRVVSNVARGRKNERVERGTGFFTSFLRRR